MRNIAKKIIPVLMSIMMLVVFLPQVAFADDTRNGTGLTSFTIDDLTIMEYTNGVNGANGYYYDPLQCEDLQVHIEYDGEQFVGDWDDAISFLEEKTGEIVTYDIVSGQDTNPWEPGNQYPFSVHILERYVSFTVTIQKEIRTFNVDNSITIIEGTCGYETQEWDDASQSYKSYYRYDPTQLQDLFVYLDINGEVYSGRWADIQSYFWHDSFTLEGQSADNPWTAGHTYNATARFQLEGRQAYAEYPVEVSIIESPIDDFTINDVVVTKYTCGDIVTEIEPVSGSTNEVSYFRYSPGNMRLNLSVVYNGSTYSGTIWEIDNQIQNSTGEYLNLSDNIVFDTNQSYANQWEVNGTYPVTAYLLGKTCSFHVTIEESQLTAFSIENTQIIKGTNGRQQTDWDTGEEYWEYEFDNNWQLLFHITYKGKEYNGTRDAILNAIMTETGEWLDELFSSLRFSTDQSYSNQWDVNTTHKVTATLHGMSCTFDATIVESPITDLQIEDMTIVAGTCGVSGNFDQYGNPFYIYYPQDSNSFKAKYKYKGTTYSTTEPWSTITGDRIEMDDVWQQQWDNPWEPGHTYTVSASYLGTECTFNVTIEPNKLSSFVIRDVHILENTSGYMTTDGPEGGNQYYAYRFPYDEKLITIEYDGESFTGNPTEVSQYLTERVGENVSFQDNWYQKQSFYQQWEAGGTYEVCSILMDKNCTYQVTIDNAVMPEQISAIGQTDITLYAGHNYAYNTIGVQYAPVNADIETEWTVTDNNIVEIGSGWDYARPYIYPVSAGHTIITATSVTNPHLKVVFNVTVTDEEPPVGTYSTSIIIGHRVNGKMEDGIKNPTDYTLAVGESFDLDASISSETCVPSYMNLDAQFRNVRLFSVEGGCGGGMGSFGGNFTYTAKAAGTETLKIGNNYTLVLHVGHMNDGWQKVNDKWYYGKNGVAFIGWLYSNNKWYYMDPDAGGAMCVGFKNVKGKWYYLDPYKDGAMATGWINSEGSWYYADQSGVIATGWLQLNGKWRYMDPETGVMSTGLLYLNDKWRYLDPDNDGIMTTGWKYLNDNWYYFDPSNDGIMATGWRYVSGKWYYFSAEGKMQTGWLLDNGNWYYLNSSGAMQTGWQFLSDQWYYFSSGGILQTGWLQLSGKWRYMNPALYKGWLPSETDREYYLDPTNDGIMVTGWKSIDGQWYYFSSGGILQKGWLLLNGKWRYMDPSTGAMYNGWLPSETDRQYYLDPSNDGIMATGWKSIGGRWYYFSSGGIMQTGWIKDGNYWYYLKFNGEMAASEWVPGYYWISANGKWTYQPKGTWNHDSKGWWFGDTAGWYAHNETIIIDGEAYHFDSDGYALMQKYIDAIRKFDIFPALIDQGIGCTPIYRGEDDNYVYCQVYFGGGWDGVKVTKAYPYTVQYMSDSEKDQYLVNPYPTTPDTSAQEAIVLEWICKYYSMTAEEFYEKGGYVNYYTSGTNYDYYSTGVPMAAPNIVEITKNPPYTIGHTGTEFDFSGPDGWGYR